MNEKKKLRRLPKRIVSFVLTLAMVLTLMPGMSSTVYATESGEAGGGVKWSFEDLDGDDVKETLHFSKIGEGNGKMTGYRGTVEHPERFVPEWESQEGYDDIINVIFDEGITEIGENAISGSNIKKVTIPDNVFVNRWAFEDCTNLTSLSLGNNIKTEDGSFENIGIDKLIINSDNVNLYDWSFRGCKNLKEVIIEGKNCHISMQTFVGCTSLEKVYFKESGASISMYAFMGTNLKEIIFAKVPAELGLIDISLDCANAFNLIFFALLNNGLEGIEDFGISCTAEEQTEIMTAAMEVYSTFEPDPSIDEDDQAALFAAISAHIKNYTISHSDKEFIKVTGEPISISVPTNWTLEQEADTLGMWYGAYVGKDSHIHRFDNSIWKYVATHHWHECTVAGCNDKVGYEEHDGDECSICGKGPAPIHEHDWKYTVGTGNAANKITAKCEGYGDCTVTGGKDTGVTLTLTATSQNYSGSAYSGASLGDKSAWESAVGTAPIIKYVGCDGTTYESETAPTEIGAYTAKITAGNVTVSANFEIKAIAPDTVLEDGVTPQKPNGTDKQVVNITPDLKNNDLSAKLSNDNLKEALGLSVEEQASGVWAWMELKAKEVSSNDVPASDKTKISSGLNGKTLGTYIDISIYKQIAGQNKTKMDQTLAEKVTITITVPSNLRTVGKDFTIVYTHNNGDAKTITPESYDEATGELVFKANEFSTYALTYTPKTATPTPTPSPESSPRRAPNTSVR